MKKSLLPVPLAMAGTGKQKVDLAEMKTVDKLKACPFCGGEATQRDFTEPFVNGWVGCKKCHCFINWVKSGKPLAVEAWNLRSEPENKPQKLCKEDENFIQSKYGYCFYTLDSDPLIYNLYVHPQYRRQGHSHELLKLVIAEIRKSGYEEKIRIQADPREDSIGLTDLTKYYRRMGLVIYDARKPEQEEK